MPLLWVQHSTGPKSPPTFTDPGWESDPTRLTIIVTHSDGTETRWSEQEDAPDAVPGDLSFGSSMPGGFQSLSTTLLQQASSDVRAKLSLFDNVRVEGPGGRVAWEGRLQRAPRTESPGQAAQVSPEAAGWSAHLTDNGTFREIYVDRDISGWTGIPVERRQDVLNVPHKPFDGTTGWSSDGTRSFPTLELSIPGYAWTSNQGRPMCEIWYDGRGVNIGRICWRQTSNVLDNVYPWVFEVFSQRPVFDTAPNAQQFITLGPDILTWQVPNPRPYIAAHLYWPATPAGNIDQTYWTRMHSPAVFGTHGLPRHVEDDPSLAGGYYASDVIADVLQRAAPKLRFTTGAGGTIQPTSHIIPHLVFADPTDPATVIGRVNAPHNYDWAVWENQTFYFHEPGGGPSRTWVAGREAGLSLAAEGDRAEQVYNGVLVTFTDFTGVQRTVGPIVSSDPDNPATRAGIQRYGLLNLSIPSDLGNAQIIGQVWLTQQARAARAGVASIQGLIRDTAGTLHPAWAVRAGDMLQVTDRPGDPLRRIIAPNYNHGDRRVEMTLDSTQDDLAALLERIGGSLVGVV